MKQRSKEELKDKHWSEILADEVLKTKKAKYVITGGMTTSGPAHMGTVCEFLYPSMLYEVMASRGIKTEFFFVADIFDAFDGIPEEMKKYAKELTPELGKPLSDVIDPLKCHSSFGEHYLSQAIEIMQEMELKINLVRAPELYSSGSFDKYALLYFKEENKVKEVVARTSLRKVEEFKEWSPIMPLCADCGKIATTRVISHDGEGYEYACDRDVEYTKGCGYRGKAKISDHKYKLQWRLHWPTWQAHFDSSAEGSGVDHMTRGGSADTSIAIHKEILKREPPTLFKYGFVLLHGRKYSKSKGIGMSALELTRLIPQEILKYALILPNLEQNKDIEPEGERLIDLYSDIERVSRLEKPENRADEKKLFAFRLAIKKLKWHASFLDMLLNYQIYRDWDKVGELLKDKEGVAYLAPYIGEWLKRNFEPEQYNFTVKWQKISEQKELVAKFSSLLKSGMSDVEVHNLVYKVVENDNKPRTQLPHNPDMMAFYVVKDDKQERAQQLFAALYRAIIGKEKGPRLGKLIAAIGIDKTKQMLDSAIK
jgi:lysyl-tRNA synthetase class 1